MRVSPDAPVDFTSESFQRRIEENLEDAPSAGSDGSTVDLSKLLLIAEDGERLTDWMRAHLRLTWCEHATARAVEPAVIGRWAPPLNIDHTTGAVRELVKAARTAYNTSA